MSVIDLLRADGSIIINKKLAHAVGIESAIMYSELISKKICFENRNELTDDGYFFNTVDNINEDTSLSKYQQGKAIKVLIELGLIKQSNRGIPQKRYFKIIEDDELLLKTLATGQRLKNSTNRSKKTKQLEVKKLDGNNTNSNNTKVIKKEKRYSIKNNGGRLLKYYNDSFEDNFNKEHPTMTKEQLINADNKLSNIAVELDLSNDDVMDCIDYHFENLAAGNDGKIFSFIGNNAEDTPIRRYIDY